MTKNELIAAVAERASLTRAAATMAVEATFETIAGTLRKGGEVKIAGFGNFKVSKRAAREGRDPRTGETVQIAAAKRPKFTAGKALKDAVND
ncbi:MAG TPA: HU family DNA-binding protein [Xanthobacteraceae bacterium]|nr:HU family DNA-binding protein [Xanthobacteraceae bacterium]